MSRPSGVRSHATAPWPNLGLGRGTSQPMRAVAARTVCHAMPPRASMPRSSGSSSISRSNQPLQVAFSSGVGLLAGGAQRTGAIMRTPCSAWPSPAVETVSCSA